MKNTYLLSKDMVVTPSSGSYRLMSGRNKRVKVGSGEYLGFRGNKDMPENSVLKKRCRIGKV